MKLPSVSTTVFAALLMASPGVALAAQAGSGAGASGNANHAAGSVAYRNIGQGGYTGNEMQGGYSGTEMPIPANNGNGNSGSSSANNSAKRPSQRNALLADNGDVRISKMIGSDIYSDQNQKIGTVDGVLAGKNGVWAVVSTSKKKVAVPFKDFVFGNADVNGHDKLVLPKHTQASLNELPVYHYDSSNYQNGNGGNGKG